MDKFGSWKPSNVEPLGKLKLQVRISNSATKQLKLPVIKRATSTLVMALADTGAQMCVADWQVAKNMGLKKSDLMVPALSVSVADNSSLELMGAHFLTIFADSGESTDQLVYFATDVGEFYLSKSALIDLNVINCDFPRVGAYTDTQVNTLNHVHNEVLDEFTSGLREDNLLETPVHHRQVAPPP